MKAVSPKTSPATTQHRSSQPQPFFQRGGSGSFMDRSAETAQAKPFFSPSPTIQAKLTIGQPNDPYEQEADQMADHVVQRLAQPDTLQLKPQPPISPLSAPTTLQPKCAHCEAEEKVQKKELDKDQKPELQTKPSFDTTLPPPDDDQLQRKCAHCGAEETVQRQDVGSNSGAATASPSVESQLSASRGGGLPLPADTRQRMEGSMGADFSGVRVHTGSSAVQMSRELNAQAFTHGSDIYFNSGKYETGSAGGQRLLAHELTHTVQQGGGIQRTISGQKGKDELEEQNSNPDILKRVNNTNKIQRQESTTSEDVLPASRDVIWGGDTFEISFTHEKEGSDDYFCFIVRYKGSLPTSGPFVKNGTVKRRVMIGAAKLNATVISLQGQRIGVDLYGYRDHIVELTDEVEFDNRPFSFGRRHGMISKSMGRFSESGSLWVLDPQAKPLENVLIDTGPTGISSADRPKSIGGISSVDITLGAYYDRFRLTLQSIATTLTPKFPIKAILGINPLYRGEPVFGKGTQILVHANPQLSVINVEQTRISLDTEGDNDQNISLNDTVGIPNEMYYDNGPIEYHRNHTIVLTGDSSYSEIFKVRYGGFIRGESPTGIDRQATSNAFATGELAILTGTTGSFEEQLDRYEIALMSIRKQAKDEHLISEETYNAWLALSQAMIRLRPQIRGFMLDPANNSIDIVLKNTAGTEASNLYDALANETKGREEVVPDYSGEPSGTTSYFNPYTRESSIYTIFFDPSISHGPGKKIATDLLLNQWEAAYTHYNELVSGLDRWIVNRLKETKGNDNELVQQAEGISTQREALGNIERYNPIRIVAVFHPDNKFTHEEGFRDSVPLSLYTWQEDGEWFLRDITNPKEPYTFPSVSDQSREVPPPRLFGELNDPDHYPLGVVHFDIPGKYGGQVKTTDYLTWKKFFSWLGFGLALIGLSLVTLGTGTVAVAGAWVLAGSAIAGGVSAAIDLIERSQRGNLDGTTAILDIAQIVAAFAGASAIASGRIVVRATAAANAGTPLAGTAARLAIFADRLYVPLVSTRIASDVITVAAFTVETAHQLDSIQTGPGSQSDKDRAKALLLSQLALSGGLLALSIKGELPQINNRNPLVLENLGRVQVALVGENTVISHLTTPGAPQTEFIRIRFKPASLTEYLTTNVSGLTLEQVKFLLLQVRKRNGSIIFGGSRVRGNVRVDTQGNIISDLDVGFDNLSNRQITKIRDDFNKKFTGSSRKQIIEHNYIYPGSEPENIPNIISPEEFFMRSGTRAPGDSPTSNQPFGPSGYIRVDPDGTVTAGRQ